MKRKTNKIKLPEGKTTWINTIHQITDEPKVWVALPLLWENDRYICVYDADGEKKIIKIEKD